MRGMGKLKLQVWVNKKYRYGKIKSTGAVYKKNQGPVYIYIYIYIYICVKMYLFFSTKQNLLSHKYRAHRGMLYNYYYHIIIKYYFHYYFYHYCNYHNHHYN